MTSTIKMRLALAAMLVIAGPVWSQESAADLPEEPGQTVESARQKADEIAEAVDRSAQAQDVSAGILTPIYKLAEMFAFPAFHWIAFAVMVAGVVSFALQLTLGKLMVLARSSFSPAEILSDALGLVVSLVGLVLTTQAAAENSNFTRSAFAVLSATAVGALAGFIFYLWGQKQELEAAEGRKKAVVVSVDEERL
ncbi:MAG: hypothetical protein ACYC0X_05915 [Pirellulaceae bacterium]